MSEFTYEFENHEAKLETYEWDNIWWEHADTEGVPRVLYIGDSISCGTRRVATEVAEEKIFFDGLGTSKGIDNPYFSDTVRMFASQQKERAAIAFNNGLHGWHLEDATEYKAYYEQMVQFLMREFPESPLLLVLTTHVQNPERAARVMVRNKAVLELAEKYGLKTVDLYSITKQNDAFFSKDGVHLLPEGYRALAECLVKSVKEEI